MVKCKIKNEGENERGQKAGGGGPGAGDTAREDSRPTFQTAAQERSPTTRPDSVGRSRFPKAIQGYSSLPKPIQGFWEKRLFIFFGRDGAFGAHACGGLTRPTVSPWPRTSHPPSPRLWGTHGAMSLPSDRTALRRWCRQGETN